MERTTVSPAADILCVKSSPKPDYMEIGIHVTQPNFDMGMNRRML